MATKKIKLIKELTAAVEFEKRYFPISFREKAEKSKETDVEFELDEQLKKDKHVREDKY